MALLTGTRSGKAVSSSADGHPWLDDLPFRVHLLSGRGDLAQVLAATRTGCIGYAAFYAAMREHPDKHVALSRDGHVICQWPTGK